MKKHMDQEVEEIVRVLLQKTGDSSEFIQKAADRSLGVIVGNVTPMRAMAALMAGGVKYVTLSLSELCILTNYFVGNKRVVGKEEFPLLWGIALSLSIYTSHRRHQDTSPSSVINIAQILQRRGRDRSVQSTVVYSLTL